MSESKDFFDAVKSGDQHLVKRMIEENPQLLDASDESGVSALLIAAYYGKLDIVELFLSHGKELDVNEAAALGKPEWLQELVEGDPSRVNEYSADGFTPLGLAAFFGRLDSLNLLIESGADVNTVSQNQMRVRPIHSAVAHRNTAVSLEMAARLLSAGAQVNVDQHGGWTPLHQAAAHGQAEMVELLLSYGADPSAKSDDDRTPLMMAEEGGYAEVVDLLAGDVN
jgi:ankyrin repeat protein